MSNNSHGLRYLSVCSGIEAATVAWHPLGWRAVAFSEIEAFPCAVLQHHYPEVPNYGDLTRYREWPDAAPTVLVGGTPCQAFSVAGLRKGLRDPRGNLTLTFLGVVDRYRPEWVVWENVPGVLSVDRGRAFGAFLGGLAELGYGWAYRVLDAQYAGVPQRRRRVFVVGHSGGQWQRAAAVLFERESLSGHPPPSRKERQRATGVTHSGAAISSGHGWWDESDVAATIRAQDSVTKADTLAIANALTARDGKGADPSRSVGNVVAHEHTTQTLSATREPAIAETLRQSYAKDWGRKAGKEVGIENAIVYPMAVRRLTPRECERLQGFPDDYTLIPYRGRMAADGPRYKALGNSMAVPVMAWIGQRIQMVSELIQAEAA